MSQQRVVYKVVEVSVVTDDVLEKTVNEWTEQGWLLDMVNYVTQPSSRRPVMAFLYFTRPVDGPEPAH